MKIGTWLLLWLRPCAHIHCGCDICDNYKFIVCVYAKGIICSYLNIHRYRYGFRYRDRNRQKDWTIERQKNKKIDIAKDCIQISRQKDRPIERQIFERQQKQISRQKDRKIERQRERQVDRQIDRQIDRKINRQINRQIDRFID